MPPLSISRPTQAQRAILNRHGQVQRQNSCNAPQPIQAQKSTSYTVSSQSPQLKPTPPTQTSSPTYAVQGGKTSPYPTHQAQHPFQQQPLQPSLRPTPFSCSNTYPPITIPAISNAILPNPQRSIKVNMADGGRMSTSASRPNQWSSSYQAHMEQPGKPSPLLLVLCIELCSS